MNTSGTICRRMLKRAVFAQFLKNPTSLIEGPLVEVPQRILIASAQRNREIVRYFVAMDVPDECASASRVSQTLKYVRVESKLHGVVPLWFAIAVVVTAFLARARLDISSDVTAAVMAKQIRFTE